MNITRAAPLRKVAFILFPDEQGWPPFETESLLVVDVQSGMQVQTAPLFVKCISVNDVIEPTEFLDGSVSKWRHVSKSDRSTIWLAGTGAMAESDFLDRLRQLGCNTESLESWRIYSVDVPADVLMTAVDPILEAFQVHGGMVAFPSFRHNESAVKEP